MVHTCLMRWGSLIKQRALHRGSLMEAPWISNCVAKPPSTTAQPPVFSIRSSNFADMLSNPILSSMHYINMLFKCVCVCVNGTRQGMKGGAGLDLYRYRRWRVISWRVKNLWVVKMWMRTSYGFLFLFGCHWPLFSHFIHILILISLPHWFILPTFYFSSFLDKLFGQC